MKKWIWSVVLIVAILLVGCSRYEEPESLPEAVTLAVATDIHYLSPELTDGGSYFLSSIENGDGKMVHYIEEITESFLSELKKVRPDYLILSGDLTFNGALESHRDLTKKLHALEKYGVQVLVIPGNHDVDSDYAVSFQGNGTQSVPALDSGGFETMYQDFGPDLAISRDESTFSYTVQAAEDLRIILLDANSYGVGWIKESTMAWLEKELDAAREVGDEVITVSHQNMYAHNGLLSFGYQLYNGDQLQNLLEEYEVLCQLSGHIHAQSIVKGSVPEIVTSSIAVSPIQYGVLEFSENTLTYHVRQADISGWAEEQGYTDANLLNFEDYAFDFFANNCQRQVRALFAESDLTKKEIDLLAEAFATLNQGYFAGKNPDYEKIKYGLALWNEQTDVRLYAYIQTIVGGRPDCRSLSITREDDT